MLRYSVLSVTLALIFYSAGVWSERRQGQLKIIHLLLLCIGLAFDITGTVLMSQLSSKGFEMNFHGITGLAAIALMLLTVLWAVTVLIRNDEKGKANFSKFGITVWVIWLIPYISGMFLGMAK